MKHWGWGIALVIALTAIALGLQSHGYEICKTNNAGHEYCTPHNLVVFCLFNLLDFLNAGGAVITALATLAIAYFTWTLRQSTEKLWDADERQMQLTRESNERQLRAHVFLEKAYIMQPQSVTLDEEFLPVLYIQVKNFGQTPAYKGIHWASTPIIREFPPDPSIPFPRRTRNVRPLARITLGPGQYTNKRISLDDNLTAQEIKDIKNRTKAIYCFGRLVYKDAFNKWRRTRYMMVYAGHEFQAGEKLPLFTFGEENQAT